MLFKLLTFLIGATLFNINIIAQNLTEQYNTMREGNFPFPGANINTPYQPDNATADSNVTLIGRWANGPCYAVDVVGNYAYFGNGGYLEIADISDPSNPVEIGRAHV